MPTERAGAGGTVRVERVLASRAGATEVLLVRMPGLGRCVLKRPHPAGARDDVLERLRCEAALLRELAGEAQVVRLLQAWEAPPMLALEYAGGGSLKQRLAAGTLSPEAGWRLFAQVLRAVGRLHAAGIIHRDLKPGNLLLTAEGELRIGDFSVAARLGSRGTLPEGWVEERIGTLGYAAPEQLADPPSAVHPAADVYSLGAILYELLTGHLPFELLPGESEEALRARVLCEPPTAPRHHRPELTTALEAVVLQALEREPRRRFPSVAALRRALWGR